MKAKSVADVEGPWGDPDFKTGLIEKCRQYYEVPVNKLPNGVIAMYIRQKMALEIMVPEARVRLANRIDDNSELYDGELAEAIRELQ